ncbi:Zinc finger CW-type PWWP domain protein 1, partial [Armadillidium nasatum]
EVKKEPDNGEVDKCFNAKEKVNFCVSKTTKKVVNNETDSNPIVKKSKRIEKVVPSKSQRNYIESFKRKFSFLYKSIIDNTDLINLPKTKSIGQKDLKRGVNISSKKIGKKDETDKISSKSLPITVKSVEDINSTPLIDHEIKYEVEDINLLSGQNKSISDTQIIHCEESSLSTELSCLKENYDLVSLKSDISETDSSSFLQDTNLEHSSGTEDSIEGIKITSRTYKQLYDLQTMTNYPVWVCCDICNKWRCLRNTIDPTIVPKVWVCSMNEEKEYSSCEAPAEDDDKENILYIFNEFTLGSLVWVTNQGSDWWPAMVDDCPDNHVYYWLEKSDEKPTQYHVTFFGSEATRAWVDVKFLRHFDERRRKTITNDQKLRKEHAIAMDQALQANSVDISIRRKKYCFAS